MANTKKHNAHGRGKKKIRNAAPTAIARLPRAVARRRGPTTGDATVDAELMQDDTFGARVLKAIGGGVGTGVIGTLLEHQSTVPAPLVNLTIGGLGAALAYGSPNKTLRSVGLGAASVGAGLLGKAILEYELFHRDEPKKDDKPQTASSGQSAAPAKKQANASDIPADALARAYERARLRMALATDAPN